MLFKLKCCAVPLMLCFMGRKWISQNLLGFPASFKKSEGFSLIFTEKLHPSPQSFKVKSLLFKALLETKWCISSSQLSFISVRSSCPKGEDDVASKEASELLFVFKYKIKNLKIGIHLYMFLLLEKFSYLIMKIWKTKFLITLLFRIRVDLQTLIRKTFKRKLIIRKTPMFFWGKFLFFSQTWSKSHCSVNCLEFAGFRESWLLFPFLSSHGTGFIENGLSHWVCLEVTAPWTCSILLVAEINKVIINPELKYPWNSGNYQMNLATRSVQCAKTRYSDSANAEVVHSDIAQNYTS